MLQMLEDWKSTKVDAKKSTSLSDGDEIFGDFECPFKIWDRHPTFPPLSDSLEIAYDQEV
jgi:hypothetical protein